MSRNLASPSSSAASALEGLTPEGERVLKWGLSIIEDCGSLEQELAAIKGELAVRASLGVVPSALPTVSVLTDAVRQRYPRITFSIHSQTSREILGATFKISQSMLRRSPTSTTSRWGSPEGATLPRAATGFSCAAITGMPTARR
ncbi:MAG: hypothetical protein R3D43_11135 [Tepidamorphaceae bacterium]